MFRLLWPIALLLPVAAVGQAQPSPCDEHPNFDDFHFWVGTWEVHTGDGTLAGRNTITLEHGECLLLERWTSARGGTGTSLNFFSTEAGEWRQVWVGAGGSLIDIRGGLVDGSMVLVGTLETIGRKGSTPFRGTWTLLDDGRVRQFFEQFDAKADAWQPWFEGFYSRTSEPDDE